MFKVHNVQHPVIILNGIKFNHFKHILEFIYQGEVKVLDIDLEGVLALGENLQVKGLSSIKLKQQVSSEELKTTALKRSSNSRDCKPKSLPSSPALNDQNILNVANSNQLKPKDFASNSRSQGKNEKNSGFRFQSDRQIHTDLKKARTENINLSAESNKSISKLESILTDPNENVQRKRFKHTEVPPAVSNGNGGVDSKISENFLETEKNSRPANAFMIFANEWRKKLKVEHPDENNKAISVKLGNMWKNLTNETRQAYYLAAGKMELDQKSGDLESTTRADSTKKKKVARRKTIDSISHLVSVDLQEFDDDDDLQIIEVNEDPIDVSRFPIKRNRSPANKNNT
ncbi:high mobility group protein B1-like isoform X2 [Anoplophora glabripennis]|nr:high mobility group protein B1-like isoform X2 [Anoplophora glabripennis]